MAELSNHRSCGRHCVVESSEMQFLAAISQQEFPTYKTLVADLQDWPTYDDFVLERDGSFLGLSWAGVNAVQVDAPLGVFARWLERTGAPARLETLDDFAMRRWLRANFPDWGLRAASGVACSSAAEAHGYLDIPLYPSVADAARKGEDISERALVGLIARECLDPLE